MRVLTNLDFGRNQILNVALQNLAKEPADPVLGQIYYDTTNLKIRIYDGTDWIDVGEDEPLELVIGNIKGLTTALDGKLDTVTFNENVKTPVPVDAKFTDTIVTRASLNIDKVDNTADTDKPISNPTKSALAKKANVDAVERLESAIASTSTSTKKYTDDKISELVGGAPESLDTLKELADALGEDKNFASTVTAELAKKTEKFVATIGNDTGTSFVLKHGMNTRDVVITVRQTGAPYEVVYTDIELVDMNSIKVQFRKPPVKNAYTVTVIG